MATNAPRVVYFLLVLVGAASATALLVQDYTAAAGQAEQLTRPDDSSRQALPKRIYRLPKDHATGKELWRFKLTIRPRNVKAVLAEGQIIFSDGDKKSRL